MISTHTKPLVSTIIYSLQSLANGKRKYSSLNQRKNIYYPRQIVYNLFAMLNLCQINLIIEKKLKIYSILYPY